MNVLLEFVELLIIIFYYARFYKRVNLTISDCLKHTLTGLIMGDFHMDTHAWLMTPHLYK